MAEDKNQLQGGSYQVTDGGELELKERTLQPGEEAAQQPDLQPTTKSGRKATVEQPAQVEGN